MTIDYQPDLANGRAFSMWSECGIQYRSNLLLRPDSVVPLHAHSYDHVTMITHGWVDVEETFPDGKVERYQMASKGFEPTRIDIEYKPAGYRRIIPAGHQHTFRYLEARNQPIEILCMWAG